MTEAQLIDIVKDIAESKEVAEAIIKTYHLENKFEELGSLDAFVDWIANY